MQHAHGSTARFWEDKIYGKEVLLEKVALKNSTYKAAIAKLEAQLAHKEEMGEVLHLVDFDQLKIENQQYMETIDTKNRELLRLKLATGRTAQVGNRRWIFCCIGRQ
jgi:predicted  nucleic acid-binding Zn-ribbon protein